MNRGQLITYKSHFAVQTNPTISAGYKIFLSVTTLPLIGINFTDYNQQ